MAETLDFQIAYSLRSEIRKKIFGEKLHCAKSQAVFSKKICVTAIAVSAKKRTTHFTSAHRLDPGGVAKPPADEIRHDCWLAVPFLDRIAGSFLGPSAGRAAYLTAVTNSVTIGTGCGTKKCR
jgi:hypothetical protein